MPIYEYECQDCGVFESMMPMSAFADPCACPNCGQSAQRVLNSVPFISTMSSGARKAHQVNEQSADGPKKLSTHGSVGSGGLERNRKTLHRPDGSKSFAASRPWMISP